MYWWFPDLGVWTVAMEQLVFTCLTLVMCAGVCRGLSLVLLYCVRGWTRLRVAGLAQKTGRK
ncbi:hypothetical protein D9M71_798910 [compost metagenome]